MKNRSTFIFLALFIFILTTEKGYAEGKNTFIEELKSQVDLSYKQERYSDSILQSLELITLSQQESDILSGAFAYKVMADSYVELGEYEKALYQLTNAIQLIPTESAPSALAELYVSMSNLLIELGRIKEAFDIVEKALPLVNMTDNSRTSLSLKYNQATILMYQGKNNEALPIYIDLSLIASEMGEKRRYGEVKNNIGMLQKFGKNYAKALDTFEQLFNYAKSNNLQELQVYSLLELGDINRILKGFKQGRDYLKQLELFLANNENLQWRSFQLSYFIALEKDAGNLALADEYQSRLDRLKPELSNFKILNRLELMKINLNVAEYKNKVSLLEKDKQLQVQEMKLQKLEQRNLLLIASVLLLLVLAFAFYQNRRRHMAALIHRQKENDRKAALERAQFMSELVEKKNKLLADVSHELRTPLTVLKLQVESLQHNMDDDIDASYQALDDKLSDIGRLISDIYQLAKSDIGALELNYCDLDLPQALDDWVNEFELLVTKNNLVWQYKNELIHSVTINADNDRIKQVLCNLLNNSVKYTDKPGRVSLSIHANQNQLFIIIEDSSPSVPEELQSQIFERLYRVEKSRSRETGGSGLGLAICKSLIEAHNGIITADTSKQGGLKITIQLPISTE